MSADRSSQAAHTHGRALPAPNPSPTTGDRLNVPELRLLRLLRLPEVKARTGFSRSEIYRRMAASPPTFPTAVKLGERASAWAEHEITEWCRARLEERDAKWAP